MSTKNTKKKKNSIFNSKNLIVLGISAVVVILFSVITTLLFPPETTYQEMTLNTPAPSLQESGLTSVYTEEVVETIGEVAEEKVEVPAETPPVEETPAEKIPTEENVSPSVDNAISFIFPVTGGVINDYSGDDLVYSKTLNDWRTHNGIDFFAQDGTEVLAAADGTVEAILENGMFGRTIILLHNDGVRTIYSNLAEGNEVVTGDTITQGTPIGKVGSSASAEALEEPHLHFEISLNEETVNPHDYLPDNSTNEE